MTHADGTELSPALGIGTASNTGEVGRGDSVAVIGFGGPGNAAIAGVRLAGAAKIIAVDRDPRKLEIDLYRQGRLPPEKFVTDEIGIEGVETALGTMHLVVLPPRPPPSRTPSSPATPSSGRAPDTADPPPSAPKPATCMSGSTAGADPSHTALPEARPSCRASGMSAGELASRQGELRLPAR